MNRLGWALVGALVMFVSLVAYGYCRLRALKASIVRDIDSLVRCDGAGCQECGWYVQTDDPGPALRLHHEFECPARYEDEDVA